MAFGLDSIIVGVVIAIPAFLWVAFRPSKNTLTDPCLRNETYSEPLGKMYILPSIWLSLWNTFIQIGFMIGSVVNGPLSDRFGRKVSMMTGVVIAIVAITVIYQTGLAVSTTVVEHS